MMDIYDDRDISSLAKILNLREEREEDFSLKRQQVHRILVSILRHGRKSPEGDIYNKDEIESIYRRRGIELDTEQIIKEGFVCSGAAYKFGVVIDNKGNTRYKLYEMELCGD